jgi:hypothetical protein
MLDNAAPPQHDDAALEGVIKGRLAAAFELPEAAVFEPGLTMGAVIAASPRLVNSVDFMEACAKVANSLKKEYGSAVRLPATNLDTPISVVVDSFTTQARAAAGSAPARSTGEKA